MELILSDADIDFLRDMGVIAVCGTCWHEYYRPDWEDVDCHPDGNTIVL